jgi:photosystem II stability/assembly factor-like uncharacterized protein
MKKFFAAIAIAFALCAAGPAPRFDAWQTVGPGGSGAMYLPTIDPRDPNVVLEHCDMTGAYITHDAGRSWRMFNLRGTVAAFAFDPKDSKTIYAGTAVLWRSADGGRTWSMIYPNPAHTTEQMREDHAGSEYRSDDGLYPTGQVVRFIVIDPADSRRLYILFGLQGRAHTGGWLFSSKDGGATWARVKNFSPEPILAVYYDTGLRVVAGSGVFTQSGQHWAKTAGPPGGPIEFASGGDGLLYATNDAGVNVSEDHGQTWRVAKNALPGSPRFLAVACSQKHPEAAYAGFKDMHIDDTPGDFFGIARTSDGGRHWTPVYQEANSKPAPNMERNYIEDFYGETGPIRDLGVSPTNPDICYGTDSCPRSFRTFDGGKTWQQTMTQRVSAGTWTTTGYDVTNVYAIRFDPFSPNTVFLPQTDIGLFKSVDGGASWKSSIQGIRHEWYNTTYWIDFDPAVKGLIWGGFAGTHDLPRPKMWFRPGARHDIENFTGGVAISTDGGDHWTVSNTGMPETPVTHILMDPASPAGSRTVYACGFGRGVYKSTDNGKTWALKINGIEKRHPFAWRITRSPSGVLYLVVSRYSERGYTGDAEDGALYRSTDGAEHWVKIKLPEGVTGPNALTLDPADENRMYLAAWGVTLPDKVVGGGVFLSTDGGQTWRNIFRDSQYVYEVTVDPKHSDIVYNVGFENGAWRSINRGQTWTRLRGFNFKWGYRVIPDPRDDSKIYISTFGGGLWHGPAAGDPKAVEDVVTQVRIVN